MSVGKTVATLLIGAAVGAAAGYMLATDKDQRDEHLDEIKNKVDDLTAKLKSKFNKQVSDIEQEIFNS